MVGGRLRHVLFLRVLVERLEEFGVLCEAWRCRFLTVPSRRDGRLGRCRRTGDRHEQGLPPSPGPG